MSEIDALYSRIHQLEDEIHKLERERQTGYEFIDEVVQGKNININEMERRRAEASKFGNLKHSAPYADFITNRMLEIYGNSRLEGIIANADSMTNKANNRIEEINRLIQQKREEINSCYRRIEQIREEERRRQEEAQRSLAK